MLNTQNLPRISLAHAALIIIAPAQSQAGISKVATVTASSRPSVIARGGKGTLIITINVAPKYHINAHKPNDPAYIPTDFAVQPTPGVVFGPPTFPKPKSLKLSYASKPLLVYTGKTIVTIPFTIPKSYKLGALNLGGSLLFQGCDEKSCYPPETAMLHTSVIVK